MDAQEAKAFLKSIRRHEREVRAMREDIERMKSLAVQVTPHYGASDGHGSGEGRMAGTVVKLVDLEREAQEAFDCMLEERRRTYAALACMPDQRQRIVLKMRYLQGAHWETIQQAIFCERTRVYEIHGDALTSFAHEMDAQKDEENRK